MGDLTPTPCDPDAVRVTRFVDPTGGRRGQRVGCCSIQRKDGSGLRASEGRCSRDAQPAARSEKVCRFRRSCYGCMKESN